MISVQPSSLSFAGLVSAGRAASSEAHRSLHTHPPARNKQLVEEEALSLNPQQLAYEVILQASIDNQEPQQDDRPRLVAIGYG